VLYNVRNRIFQLFISYGVNDWNRGLKSACLGGHLEIVKLMVDYSFDWNTCLLNAYKSGIIEIVQLIINKGGAEYPFNWNKALELTIDTEIIGVLKGQQFRVFSQQYYLSYDALFISKSLINLSLFEK